MPALCHVGDGRPIVWHGAFCATCAQRLGFAGRALVVAGGRKGVARAIERLRAAYASLSTVRRKVTR